MNAEEQVQKVRDVVKNWDAFIEQAEKSPDYPEGWLGMMKAARNDIKAALGDER